MTDKATSIAAYILNGSKTIEQYQENSKQIEAANQEREIAAQNLQIIKNQYEKVIESRKEGNAMILAAIPVEVKNKEFQKFDEKTGKYEADLKAIFEEHLAKTRQLELESIKALKEAQDFELETIRKLKA